MCHLMKQNQTLVILKIMLLHYEIFSINKIHINMFTTNEGTPPICETKTERK